MKENSLKSPKDVGFDNYFMNLIQLHKINQIRTILSDNPNLDIWTYEKKDNNNFTILHLAVFQEYIDLVREIIDYLKTNLSKEDIASFINKETTQGVTALHYASFKGKINLIELLIENGGDCLKRTKRKLTVLHYAAQGNQPNSIVYFHEIKHMDISLKDAGSSTPLHWAVFSTADIAITYLLQYGANINQKDNDGYTPLHLAVLSGNIRIVKKLLQKGADINIKDNSNEKKKPIDIAYQKKMNEIVEIINQSKKCQICIVKAPLREMRKSRFNIYMVVICQILLTAYFYIILCPFFATLNNNESCLLPNLFQTFYLLFLLLFFSVYIFLIVSNPGKMFLQYKESLSNILLKDPNREIDLIRYCPQCRVLVNQNVKHCIICDVCIKDFDHHCYWVNNCIGKKNYFWFLVFLYVAFLFLLFFNIINVIGIVRLILEKEIKQDNKCQKVFDLILSHKLNILLLQIFFLLLGLFFFVPLVLLTYIHTSNCIYNSRSGRQNTLEKNETILLESQTLA